MSWTTPPDLRGWASARTPMRHVDYIRSPEWRRRNAAFRADPDRRACECCPPVVRRRVRTQTHHCYYRCGVCGQRFNYWTHLADHWQGSAACGATRQRLGGERDGDLRSLCDFHHRMFEAMIQAGVQRAIRRHRPKDRLPNRKRWTLAYIGCWRLAYLSPALAALGFGIF